MEYKVIKRVYTSVCISRISNGINCFHVAEIKRTLCVRVVDGIIISWYNNNDHDCIRNDTETRPYYRLRVCVFGNSRPKRNLIAGLSLCPRGSWTLHDVISISRVHITRSILFLHIREKSMKSAKNIFLLTSNVFTVALYMCVYSVPSGRYLVMKKLGRRKNPVREKKNR